MVEELVKEMTQGVSSFESEYKYEFGMLQYDLILQAVLIASAIADGSYLAIENSFIEKIADYGDITLAFNQRASDENLGIEELDWDGLSRFIVNADDELRVKLVSLFGSIAWDYSNTLIGFFAPIDAVIERDYLKEIYEATLVIVLALAEIDGDDAFEGGEGNSATKEIGVATNMLDTLLVRRWKQKIAEFEAWRRRNNPDEE